MTQRLCLACGQPLQQRQGESTASFARRKNCNRQCAARSRGSERGQATTYRSRYAAGWISAPQYLAEMMCERAARHTGKELPAGFWSLPEWKRLFGLQLRLANALLAEFSAEAILRTLRSETGKKAYSLGAPWLRRLMVVEENLLRRQASMRPKEVAPAPVADDGCGPRQPYVQRPSLLDKLRDT